MLSKKVNFYPFIVSIALVMSNNIAIAADAPSEVRSDKKFTTHDLSWDNDSSKPPLQSAPDQTNESSVGDPEEFFITETDDTMKALIGLSIVSKSEPAGLSVLAQEMGISTAQINVLYVTSLAIRDLYEKKSLAEISNWCKEFSQQSFDDAASAEDIAEYQQSLADIDSVVLGAVKVKVDELSADYPQVYATIMDNTQSYDVQSSGVNQSSISPGIWIENHQKACLEYNL